MTLYKVRVLYRGEEIGWHHEAGDDPDAVYDQQLSLAHEDIQVTVEEVKEDNET